MPAPSGNVVKIRPPLVFAQQRRRGIPRRVRCDDRRAQWIGRRSAETFTPAAREALKAFPIEPDALELVSLAENVTFGWWTAATAPPTCCGCTALAITRSTNCLGARLDPRAGRGRHRRPGAGARPRRPGLRPGDDPGHRRAALRRHGALDRGPRCWPRCCAKPAIRQAVEAYFEQLGALTAVDARPGERLAAAARLHAPRLDADGLMGDAPHWGPFWDHRSLSAAERRLVLDTRARLHAALARLGREPVRLQHDPRRHASRQRPGRRRAADRHRLRRCGLGLARLRHRRRLAYQQGKPNASKRSNAPFVAATARCGGSRTKSLALLPMFRLVRGLAPIGWFHQRPELERAARFRK